MVIRQRRGQDVREGAVARADPTRISLRRAGFNLLLLSAAFWFALAGALSIVAR
jgi:hypothetical protein